MELCSDHYQNTNVTAPRSSKAHVLQLQADSPRPLPSLPSSALNLLSLVRGERLQLLRLHGNFAAAFV